MDKTKKVITKDVADKTQAILERCQREIKDALDNSDYDVRRKNVEVSKINNYVKSLPYTSIEEEEHLPRVPIEVWIDGYTYVLEGYKPNEAWVEAAKDNDEDPEYILDSKSRKQGIVFTKKVYSLHSSHPVTKQTIKNGVHNKKALTATKSPHTQLRELERQVGLSDKLDKIPLLEDKVSTLEGKTKVVGTKVDEISQLLNCGMITYDQVQLLKKEGYKKVDVAKILEYSESTIKRHWKEK